MRLSRVIAVARRDLSQELKGRQGLVLPVIIAALLVPTSTIPPPEGLVDFRPKTFVVVGDVPDEVAALDSTTVGEQGGHIAFKRTPTGTLRMKTKGVPPEIREALDQGDPEVIVESLPTGFTFPGRTLLFGLISASTLTGAVSASVGGERSRRTLVVLLAASISRFEIVVGKWAAWGGLGATTALLAALLAVVLGNVDLGWWLLPLPTVPICAVAFGLWLVRRAGDVIAGTTISLRVLPALLAMSGLTAWFLGRWDPLLGALVPLGGALVASGDTWPDPAPVLLATAVTMGAALACVAGTARDLEEVPAGEPHRRRTALAVLIGGLAAMVWWLPLTVPLLWAEAGNARLTEELPRDAGVLGAGMALLAFTVVRMGRSREPAQELGAWHRGPVTALAAGVGAALLVISSSLWGWPPAPGGDLGAAASLRLVAAIQPAWAGVGTLVGIVVVDEILFRGWLTRAVGPIRAGIVFTVVKAPFDLVGGAAMAAILGIVGHRGGLGASIAARLTAAAIVGIGLPSLPPVLSLAIVGAGVAGLWFTARRE